jgi:hypothetical protein
MAFITLKVNFRDQLKRFKLVNNDRAYTRAMFKAGLVHRNYLRRRFLAGGGDPPWASLSPTTIKRKEYTLAPKPTAILRHTDTLMNSIEIREFARRGVVVGIFSTSPHPRPTRKNPGARGRKSTREVAMIQSNGRAKNLPPRPIVVPPPKYVRRKMLLAASQSLSQSARQRRGK